MIRRTVLPLMLHLLLTLAVAVWFGIWFLGPVVLIMIGVDDPRNIFGEPFTAVGCGVLVLGWFYFVITFALSGHLPD